jgi:hypothetical protein
MSFNVYQRVVGNLPRYTWGVYGIEVEAERLGLLESDRLAAGEAFNHELLQAMTRRNWRAITDGSLRHRGVEFITPPSTLATCSAALSELYAAMREGLFQPSVRTGIHIHVNVQTFTNQQMIEFMRTYAVLEPLLFQAVGVEREQNIYCVPLYRGSNEQRLWRQLATRLHNDNPVWIDLIQLMGTFRSFCKYSAINFESFLRLGTFEFRHAPTWGTEREAQRWLQLVHQVCNVTLTPDATMSSLATVRPWAEEYVPGLNWDAYVAEVEERGLLDFANSLQPFTYKVPDWGRPAGLAFGRAVNTGMVGQEPVLAIRPATNFVSLTLDGIIAEHEARVARRMETERNDDEEVA